MNFSQYTLECIDETEIQTSNPVQVLGSGSCGKVYVAQVRGTPVAVKQMPCTEEFVFKEEIGVMMMARHPYIILCMGYGISQRGNTLSIITEIAHGGDLDKLLRIPDFNKKISMVQRRRISREIAQGLEFSVILFLISDRHGLDPWSWKGQRFLYCSWRSQTSKYFINPRLRGQDR